METRIHAQEFVGALAFAIRNGGNAITTNSPYMLVRYFDFASGEPFYDYFRHGAVAEQIPPEAFHDFDELPAELQLTPNDLGDDWPF